MFNRRQEPEMKYRLPDLNYDYASLEPYIDRRTMEIHHRKHHASYVDALNAALDGYPQLQTTSIEDLLAHLHDVPYEIRLSIRNNGGGHVNHSMFWQTIAPPSTQNEPTGALGDLIRKSFGSVSAFKDRFGTAALSVFGSGWAWLVDRGDRLVVETTVNQDSPLMEGRTPLFGLDVWEHAYYLQYQNRRKEYVDACWHVVDWAEVGRRLTREVIGIGHA
jgi:Fe-Mn family superoxide dismutase